MTEPEEYRRFAAECAAAARHSGDPDAREVFLRMERAWLRLAVIADKRAAGGYSHGEGLPDDSDGNGHEA